MLNVLRNTVPCRVYERLTPASTRNRLEVSYIFVVARSNLAEVSNYG